MGEQTKYGTLGMEDCFSFGKYFGTEFWIVLSQSPRP